jgi:hypothetical protein
MIVNWFGCAAVENNRDAKPIAVSGEAFVTTAFEPFNICGDGTLEVPAAMAAELAFHAA